MNFDLEHPSCERKKLESGSNTFIKILQGAENMHLEEDHINSLTEEENVGPVPQQNAGTNFSASPDASFNVPGGEDDMDIVEDENSLREEQNDWEVPRQKLAQNSVALKVRETDVVGVDDLHGQPAIEPCNGLEFDTKEAAYAFYREYARSVGFGITIKASRRSKKTGKFIDVKIVCCRFGSKRESDTALNSRPCAKTDCKAGMHIKRREDEMWIIHNFVKEHNHDICPDDFYHSFRGLSTQLNVCRKKGLQSAFGEEDVKALLENFMSMQDENPNFFYSIDLDHDKRIRNILWVDPNGNHDYCSFYDVVFFDTFYVSNKYNIPLVPIVGVNNNNQYIFFGTALIGNDTTSTYIWMMQTWLKAVGGRSPRVIITDLDNSLKEAVEHVFPETRHCFCLWHILRKISEHLGYVTSKYENFMKKFNKCIYHSLTEEEFDSRWMKMVNKFELLEDELACSLYEDREKWVPLYMQDVFLAGMSTAKRSESITSFFDKYIFRDTTVKDFIEKYKMYLQERYELQAKVRAETQERQSSTQQKCLSPFNIQMSAIYTDAIFEQFQNEVSQIVSCHVQKENENDEGVRFRVEDSGANVFTVVWNEKQLEIHCSCRSFEYKGFLCRHALLVLQTSGLSNIPPHYILKRWTKDAKIRDIPHCKSTGASCRYERFNDLCRRAIRLGQEASLSHEAYIIAFSAMEQVLRQCVGLNNSVKNVSEPISFGLRGSVDAGGKNQGTILGKFHEKKKTCKKRKMNLDSAQVVIQKQDSSHQEQVSLNARAEGLDDYSFPHQDPSSGQLVHEDNDGSPSDAEDAEPVSSIPPIRSGCYIDFSAGLGHSDPISTQMVRLDNTHGMQGDPSFQASAAMGCVKEQPDGAGSEELQGTSLKKMKVKAPDASS